MHLVRLFLTAWFELGTVTVFFLFWLCKRTAQRIHTLDKPALDPDTFQQLLAAAYTLQEQNRHPIKKTEADSSKTVSLPPESFGIAQCDVELLPSVNDSAVPSSRERRIPRRDEFFERIAAVTGIAAVLGLLLIGWTDHFSPLPTGPVVQQRGTLRIVVATKSIVMEPQATKAGPNQRTVDAGKSGKSTPSRATRRTRPGIPFMRAKPTWSLRTP